MEDDPDMDLLLQSVLLQDYDSNNSDSEFQALQRSILGHEPPSSSPRVAAPSSTSFPLPSRPRESLSTDSRPNYYTTHPGSFTSQRYSPVATRSAVPVGSPQNRKRSRNMAGLQSSPDLRQEPKSRRVTPIPPAQPNSDSLVSDDIDEHLLQMLGMDDDEDIRKMEEEQRVAEAWLNERKDQERRDAEFARALQQNWNNEVASRPTASYSSPTSITRDAMMRGNRNPPPLPPPQPSGPSRTLPPLPSSSQNHPNQTSARIFGGHPPGPVNPGRIFDDDPESWIEISSDSELEEIIPLGQGFQRYPYASSGRLDHNRSMPFPSPPIPPSIRGLQMPPELQQYLPSRLGGYLDGHSALQPNPGCPPGCTCKSSINKLREMYSSERGNLSQDDMKKELKSLLENIRPDGEMNQNREGTPDALKFNLMEHQKLGLAWMKSMEEGSNKGGILADDMGLGKTIQALALMVARPAEDENRKTNLIVAPVALVQQWKREIKRMLHPGPHQLSVLVLHGEKRFRTFKDLSKFDVVITTFGSLGSELKRKERWKNLSKENPDIARNVEVPAHDFPVLGDGSKWYRVIVDEAQCIKNHNTKAAQACYEIDSIYRWCMSGTPMMNNVGELYSLIRFLRIRPYNKVDTFNATFTRPLKTASDVVHSRAMQQLQALLKAILLRRTKTSKIDGKPILQLPPRITEQVHAVFSDDENELYRALETQTQLQFNRYLQAGTVGRNYSNMLVLLLRLRQACCHPHLIHDFAVESNQVTEEVDLVANAKQFDATVVSRLKDNEAPECPVCIDVAENAIIFFPCGHSTCTECFARISDPSQGLAQGHDGTFEIKCPNCRTKIDPKKITDNASFRKVHYAEDTGAGDTNQQPGDANEDSSSDDDDDDEGDESDSLGGFIVNDEDDPDGQGARRSKKRTKKDKGKGKAVKKPRKSLAELKKEAMKNAKAKRKYLKSLAKRWETSAKVDKTMELLQTIADGEEGEKTIIFSQFTSLLDLLEVPIMRKGWGYRRYDGSMKPVQRNEAVLDFTDNPDCKIMLVSLKAGNAGLNLVAASQVIILDPFWNPYIEDQAIDRAHRIGQLRPVVIHRILIENTVEDRILSLQDKKRELIEGALDEKASSQVGRLGIRELAFLFNSSMNGSR